MLKGWRNLHGFYDKIAVKTRISLIGCRKNENFIKGSQKKGKKAFFIERLRFSSEDRGGGGITQFPSDYRERKKKRFR